MAVGVGVLHIDDLCKGLGNLADQGHGLLVPLLKLLHAVAHVHTHEQCNQNQTKRHQQDHEPKLLVKLLLLYNHDADFLVAAAQRIMNLHHVFVGAAAQVGVVHGDHLRTADCITSLLKTFKMAAHLRIAQGVVEDE